MRARALAAVLVAVAAGVAIAGGVSIARRGFSTRDEPSRLEAFVARRVRALAVPARVRDAKNPVSPTPEALADARVHFADHCAVCHGNDGAGHTAIGQGLYPKAPDMRLDATQRLTDGEIYAIIKNGVRLTGMPAWGAPGDDNDEDSWKLVHFIRRLRDLTPEHLKEMEKLNPKTPAEFEEERRDEEFLRGAAEPVEAAKPQPPTHTHKN